MLDDRPAMHVQGTTIYNILALENGPIGSTASNLNGGMFYYRQSPSSLKMFLLSIVNANFGANWNTDPDQAPFNFYQSTIVVPPIPDTQWATIFVWPGLQPGGGAHFLPIDNGVLQPVLTYGTSCAPNPNNKTIDYQRQWWISGQYVNTFGHEPGFSGCLGGNRMVVSVGDQVQMTMALGDDGFWTQTIVNLSNKQSVSFSINLQQQAQGWAEFVFENTNGWHSNPPAFTVKDIELRTATSNPNNFCSYSQTGDSFKDGATLECSTPQFPSVNVCKISECLFNQNAKAK